MSMVLISIVDDDEALRKATKSLLRALGFNAETFDSAENFLASGQIKDTACLIADMQMPQMSGLDLHRHLIAAGISIPTILFTAYLDDRTEALASKAGVTCCLPKPFTKDQLLASIHLALDGAPP